MAEQDWLRAQIRDLTLEIIDTPDSRYNGILRAVRENLLRSLHGLQDRGW